MSLVASFKRLFHRAHPGFPEHHVMRLGVVVAIEDPPRQEVATDDFRPRYAVDVQLLTPQGEPDPARPVLRGLPLPAHGGIYAFPELGQQVRVGFLYGLPSHPYIDAVLNVGQPTPAVLPGERVWQHSDGHFAKWDARGNLHIQTDGELREDSHLRMIVADAAAENLGSLTRTVHGDQSETIGNLVQLILGGLQQSVGADVKVAILGVEDRAIGGDKSELVGGKYELAANLGFSVFVVPGVGAIVIGNGAVDLVDVLDQLAAALQLESHGYTDDGSPAITTVPVNVSAYLALQALIQALKGL